MLTWWRQWWCGFSCGHVWKRMEFTSLAWGGVLERGAYRRCSECKKMEPL